MPNRKITIFPNLWYKSGYKSVSYKKRRLCLPSVIDVSFWPIFLLHTILWFLLDVLLVQVVQNHQLEFTWIEIFLSWALNEALAIPIFFGGILSRRITWRNQTYQLHFGGKTSPLLPEKDGGIMA